QAADPDDCLADPNVDENCDEVPQRQVQLSAFSIEVHEVTNAQYRRCVEAQRCSLPARPMGIDSAERFFEPEFDDYPVVWVSRVQAQAYCAWAGGRLPTEAEWERAARGDAPLDVTRIYPWGDADPGCARANIDNCVGEPQPVGQFDGDVSAGSILDLAGNVHEFVSGWYDPLYYRRAPEFDPPGAENPGAMELIPVRGGSYATGPEFSTVSYRGSIHLVNVRRRQPDLGFRCVQTRAGR
ncbi:MAG: SUMF1/EgtB/PvdO family nonheme iron enzyme, partial [Myxococcales bacterium]|nr:SUMF1/EgtB/PvdO family nonheme iron enzyme [Myxococcales bacterium]